jgi:hypothetical protein
MESSGAWGYSGANTGNPRITATFEAPCYALNKYVSAKHPEHLFSILFVLAFWCNVVAYVTNST